MSSNRKAEKNRAEIHALGIKSENRECADCMSKSTPYVIMDFGTFVCSTCSGIHRSHQFRVKGISMSNFSDSEVDRLKELGGNEAANAIWRATWDRKQFPKPRPSEEARVKEFIRRTYVEKRWYRSEGGGGGGGGSRRAHEEEGDVPVEPISKIIKDPAPIHVQRSAPSHISTSNSGSFVRPRRVSNAAVPAQQDNNLLFSDASVTNGKSTAAPAAPAAPVAPAKAATSGMDLFFGGDDFTPDWNGDQSAKSAQKPPRKASGFSLADELFSNVPPPPQQHQQWGPVAQPPPQQQPWGQPQGFGPGPQQQQWGQMQNFGGFVPQPHMQPQWGVPYPQQQQQWPGSFQHPQQQPQPQQWGQPQVQSHVNFDDPFGADIQPPQQQQQQQPQKSQDDLFGDLSAFRSGSGGGQRSAQNIKPLQKQKQPPPPPQRFDDDPFGSDVGFGSVAPTQQPPNQQQHTMPSDNPFDF